MAVDVYRFEFDDEVSLEETEMTLQLALLAVEGLFGQARVRMEMTYRVNEAQRAIVADASTEVGHTVARMFTGLLIREFGEEAFQVRRIKGADAGSSREVRA